MIDRHIERRMSVLSEFIGLWVELKTSLAEVAKKPHVSTEEEQAFLEVKSHVARKQQALVEVLAGSQIPDREITAILSQAVSLSQLAAGSGLLARKLETDWHEVYISLNRVLGSLENQKAELARVNALGHMVGRLFRSRLLWLLAIVVCLVLFYRALGGGGGEPARPGPPTGRRPAESVSAEGQTGFERSISWFREKVWNRLFKGPREEAGPEEPGEKAAGGGTEGATSTR